jgi:catechol 2,3-dioxygenase-like lactoylglutathione lyase family enzyme
MITAMPRIAIATNDFTGIVGFFRDTLGMPVVDISGSSVESLGAKLGMCVPEGGSNIELMCPAVPEAPLSQSLTRFLERRGEGLFALMLEAPDPNAEAERLAERGLDVLPLMAGAGGRDVHPRSTHGVLIRVYPNQSFQSPPDQVQLAGERDLGLSGISRVVLAVHDLEHAVDVYGRQFGTETDAPVLDEARGLLTAICRPPSGGVIELVAVADREQPFANAVAAQLETRGEGMHALVLGSKDPGSVAASLADRGVPTVTDESGRVICDGLFGTRILIEASG